MWFLGLVIGLLVGGVGIGGGGAVFGGLAGALLAHLLGRVLMGDGELEATKKRVATLEKQVEWLHRESGSLRAEIARLESRPAAATVPMAEPAGATAGPTPAVQSEAPVPGEEAPSAALSTATPPLPPVDATPLPAARPAAVATPAAIAGAAVPPRVSEPSPAPSPPSAPPRPAEPAAAGSSEPIRPRPAPPRPTAEALSDSLWQRLFAGNLVAKVGVVILFFGIAFLLKYAYERAVLPPEFRLVGVAVAGFVMLWLGRRLGAERPLFATILQGGGVGVFYLDVYFALKIFGLLGPTSAFALFLALGIGTVGVAVRQDARALAVLGLIGAFLAPPLASRGGGSHVLLFSYYLMLNAFIVAVSGFKCWRELNLTGFVFTFVVALAWGAGAYRPEHFASVEPFLIAYFVMYLVIPVLFARAQPPQLKGLVDGTLVFGTPLAVAFLQAQLVRGMGDQALAWSAGGGAVIYLALAVLAWRGEWTRLLGEAYLALAVVLATLAVFFAFDAYPTFALWTLEGAAVLWVGLRQQRPLARGFGVLLQLVGAIYFASRYRGYDVGNPYFNDFVVGCALIVVAGLVSGWLLWRRRELLGALETRVAEAFPWWAAGWWFAGSLHMLHQAIADHRWFPGAALMLAAASFALFEWAGSRSDWPALRRVTLAQVPALLLGVLSLFGERAAHPLGHLGIVGWPAFLAAYFWCLWRQERDGVAGQAALRYRLGWSGLALLGSWDVVWLLRNENFAGALGWSLVGFAAAGLRYRLREVGRDAASPTSRLALAWAWLVALAAAIGQARASFAPGDTIPAVLGFAAAAGSVAELAGRPLGWPDLRRSALLLLPAMLVTALALLAPGLHPLHGNGAWAWPLALAALYLNLWRQEGDALEVAVEWQHRFGLWAIVVLATWEFHHLAGPQPGWQAAGLGLPSALLLIGVSQLSELRAWPCGRHAALYLARALPPLAAWAGLWTLTTNLGNSGAAAPLPHVTLLNPVDFVQATLLGGLWLWWRRLQAIDVLPPGFDKARPVLLALVFVWLNGIVLRGVHHWAKVPFDLVSMLHSVEAQAATALLWSVTALALMGLAAAQARRGQWMAGAALLALVVLKLFLVDLGNSGTVARIVSFIGVGLLLLLIGYLAPVPPDGGERPRR